MCNALENDNIVEQVVDEIVDAVANADDEQEPPIDVDSDIDDEDKSWDSEKQMVLKAKWSLDGTSTLDEVIERSYELIEYYKQLKADGWELEGSIEDDWGFLRRN